MPKHEGTAFFRIQDEMRLNIGQTTWEEKLTVSKVRLVGKADGIRITPSHSAGGASASAGGALAHPFVLSEGSTHSGTVTYNAGAIAGGTKEKSQLSHTNPSHTFTGTKAGYTPARLTWKFEKARCDDMCGEDAQHHDGALITE
ncbi:hypothetical protein FCH28_07985 [Streptomyces piniterrae]|uniref:Uncharacterized protein n=1 Tax=Streptomyces piniterrae TaxID=2571125 RepID=A0A4U0NS59_9ACTN|nr:hypothetical protein FCH28_07985 [Streptomyces piniterrae]